RELIQEIYLPQRLAISYLKADGNEKEIFLTALKYTGELENKYIGDPFAGEIARFYSALPENRLSLLKQAHSFVKEGYQLGRNEEYGKALIKFESAYQLFLQSGDIWEAELSRYSIAYYLYNNNKLNESLIIFSQITDFCRTKNYKWLQQSAIHWVAGAYIALRKYTQAKKNYQQALSLAEEIKDSFSIQRNLTGLANIESSVGRTQQAAAYMQRALEESNAVDTSLRQRWRNYYAMLKVMISAKLFNAAKFLGRETMYLAEKNQNPLFTTLSYIGAGTAYVQSGNYEEAKDWLWDGRHAAESMVDASAKKKIAAYSYLRLGHLERQTGNYESSLQLYNEAIGIYETLNLPFYLYEAYKGRLLTNIGLKNNRELEEQIPATLKLVEEYRTTILDEQERNSFFDTEQSVYDIAVEYEFKREKFEDAYNYAEKSNSRSLLDWLQKGAKISGEQKKLEILLEENVAPLTLPEIRQQMPAEVQILQYSVLEDKILIWVISKEKFTYTPVDISLEELRRKIKSYVDLVQDRNQTAQTDAEKLGRELYDLLIKPVSAQLDPARHICLIPNKFLFYLPFAALINPEEKPFLADFNFFYAPSANVFLFCTLNALKKTFSTSETFLGVGNPAFKRDDFDDLSKLPEAEKEVAEVAALYADSQIL
ncbi:MAG TPA: CHAT domain-containing protein, partial [Sphingobacteriaceae bacterium]